MPNQDPVGRRYQAAQDLERARQVAREAQRYGLATQRHTEAVAAAEAAYDTATRQVTRR